MKQTTLEKTALIHAHGIHCGASYLGLSLQYGTSAPDIHLFEKMWTPNVLNDIMNMVDQTMTKNKILSHVKKAIGSCGATMMIDKGASFVLLFLLCLFLLFCLFVA